MVKARSTPGYKTDENVAIRNAVAALCSRMRMQRESEAGKKSEDPSNAPESCCKRKLFEMQGSEVHDLTGDEAERSPKEPKKQKDLRKSVPRDMAHLTSGATYQVVHIGTWGKITSLQLRCVNNPADCDVYRIPITFRRRIFHVGDLIQLKRVAYNASRNKVAKDIGVDSSRAVCALRCDQPFGPRGGCCSRLPFSSKIPSPLLSKESVCPPQVCKVRRALPQEDAGNEIPQAGLVNSNNEFKRQEEVLKKLMEWRKQQEHFNLYNMHVIAHLRRHVLMLRAINHRQHVQLEQLRLYRQIQSNELQTRR